MRTFHASVFVSLALLAVACGGNSSAKADGATGRCIPGQSAACTGTDACSGFQVCNASGTFEACVCGTGSDASSGAPSAPDAIEASPITIASYVTTFAGTVFTAGSANGTGSAATFDSPSGIAVDSGGVLYVGDQTNNLIRSVTPAGAVGTFAGTGSAGSANGSSDAASFFHPAGIAVDGSGNVYVADDGNDLIRVITSAGMVSTFAGTGSAGSANGSGSAASFASPAGVAVDASGNVYVADDGNNLIRKITPAGVVSTLAGTGSTGSANGPGSAASFDGPGGIAIDAAGNLYVADQASGLLRVVTSVGVVSTLASGFSSPDGVAADAVGNIYVTSFGSNTVSRVTSAGVVNPVAGDGDEGFADGSGGAATLDGPVGIAVDSAGNLYVTDPLLDYIRLITPTGIGQLQVAWSAASSATSYTATATATGQTTKTCAADASTFTCTINELTTGVVYVVSVTATNAKGTSPPSLPTVAIPN